MTRTTMNLGQITDTTTGTDLLIVGMFRTTDNDQNARLAVTEDGRVWLGYPGMFDTWSHAGTLGDNRSGTKVSGTNARMASNM